MQVLSQKLEIPADEIGMDLFGIAQQGLQQAQGQFNQSAQRIAQINLNTGQSQTPVDSVSLSDAAVSMLSAKDLYQVDLSVAHAANDMEKATLNLLA